MPFGGFLTEDSLSKPLDFKLFPNGINRTIIILTEEDCIVQYAKFYIEFLVSKLKKKNIKIID